MKRSSKSRCPVDDDLPEEEELNDEARDRFIRQARSSSVAICGEKGSLTVFVLDPLVKSAVQRAERLLWATFDTCLAQFGLEPGTIRYDQLDFAPIRLAGDILIQLNHGILEVTSTSGFVCHSQRHDYMDIRHPTLFRLTKATFGHALESIYHSQRGVPEVAQTNVFEQSTNRVLTATNSPFADLLNITTALIHIQRKSVAHANRPSLDHRVQNPAIARFKHLVVAAPAAATGGASYAARLMNRHA